MSDYTPVTLSVISPVYRGEQTLEALVAKIKEAVEPLGVSYEIVLVEDASPDNSWDVIKRLAAKDACIRAVKLSRNFGQHPAIFCGLRFARGEAVVVIDCDLQEDPAYIPHLFQKYREGYDIVYTYRKKRSYGYWKNVTAYLYTKIYNYLIDNKLLSNDQHVGAFSLISRKVVDAFLQFKDCQFHYLLVLRWMGFRSTYVEIEHHKRYAGKSSYNFKRLIEHALVAIVFHSDKLLRLNIYLGFLIAFVAFVVGGWGSCALFYSWFCPGVGQLVRHDSFFFGLRIAFYRRYGALYRKNV